MKMLLLLLVAMSALSLGGCEVSRPLIPDEQYEATHGPAPYAPDPTGHVPQNR